MSHEVCSETNFLRIEQGKWRLHAKAKRSAQKGTVLTRNVALAHKLLEHFGSSQCSYCLSTPSKLYRCSSCKSVHYCGRDCQKTDFAQHKFECQYLQHHGGVTSDQDEELCLLLRTFGALQKIKKQRNCRECEGTDGNGIGTIQCGFNHWDAMAQASHQVEQPSPLDTIQTVSKYTKWPCDDIRKALRIFQANNFGILNSLHETIGQGVYPHAALLNHSCDPNCLLRFNSTALEIVALRDIEKDEELTHSYVDLVQDTATRREHLQHLHGFVCDCTRCQGLVCVKLLKIVPSHVYEWLIQHRNPTLSNALDEGMISISINEALHSYGGGLPCTSTLEKGRQLLQEAQQYMAADEVDAELSTLKVAVKILEKLPPLSRDLYQARGALLSSLLVHVASCESEQQREHFLQEARVQCLAMVAFLTVALPENHPLLGLQLFTLGDLKEDASIYKWARDVLRVSHGKSHDLVRRLDDILLS
jgi:hypothetical protein